MKRKLIILFLAFGAFTACQNNEELGIDTQIAAISPADLPASSQAYIDENFKGEVVTDAFRVRGTDREVTYEAFMSNNTNLVFDDESDLCGFGNINSRMGMEDEMFDGGMQNKGMHGSGDMQNGGMNGNGGMQGGGMHGNGNMHDDDHGGMIGEGHHEFRDHPEAMPEELDLSELPMAILDYLEENYPENEILKAFMVVWDDETIEIHVLIQDVGGLLFDEDGTFIDMIRRGNGHCEDFEEIEVENLSASVLEYIDSNYPDDEIVRARLGSHDGIEQIHVMLENAGILVFDADGNFIELMERRRQSHHG